MKQLIKRIEELLKSADPEDKAYAKLLMEWFRDWLISRQGGVQTQDDSGDHPPPPPPRK